MPEASLNYYQSVNVAKVKTDLAPFTSIQAAVDAITDNAAGKRYLVRVHPGTYTEKVITEDYIDLVAVGGREETIITFTATAHDEPTLTAENSLVKGFTIVSDGSTGTFRTRAVSAATAGFEMEDCILTVTNSAGVTDVCLNASASCDIRDCTIDSTGTSVTGALFTTAGQTYNVARCTFDGATDAIQETTTPTLNLEDCTIADNFNQDGGTVNIRRCRMEAVALGTAACTVAVEMTTFSAAFATADAFAHTITCTKCSFAGQNFTNAATGATTINLRDCDGINTLTNAGVAGTVNLYDCGVETLTTTQGTIVAYGGRINACGGSTGTSFVWWQDTNRLNVISSMRIADALAAAGAGDVVCLMPGTYAESNLTLVASVDLVGTDSTQCVISADSAANAILNAAVTCTISNITVTNQNAAAPAIAVTANTLTLRTCTINGTGAGDAITMVAGTLNAHEVSVGAGDINLSTAICTLNMYHCRVTTDPIDTAGAFAHVLTFEHCDFGAQNIASAATAATTITVKSCSNIGAITHAGTGAVTIANSTAGAITNSATATMTITDSALGAISQAAAAGTINITNSSMTTITTGAAGTVRLNGGCLFTDISANAGVLTWKIDPNHIKVVAGTANMKIADALTLAAAGDVITVYPGTYAESNLTLKASVDLVGTDPDQCVILAAGPAVPILAAAVTCSISNITVGNSDATGTAITVTANVLTARNCYIYGTGVGDAIAMTAGTLTAYDSTVGAGDIDLSTAICTLNMYRCKITTEPVDTAGAFAHVLTFEGCDFGAVNLASAATGATVITARACTNIGAITHAGTGALTIDGCSMGAVTVSGAATTTIGVSTLAAVANNSTGTMTINESSLGNLTQAAAAGTINAFTCKIGDLSTGATGTIRLNGGCLFTDIAANAGALTWKLDPNRIRVVAGTANMKIADALTLAAAGDTILIGQGTFAESNLTMVTGIDLVGEGFGLSVVETTDNANPIVAVGNNIACELHGLKVSNLGTGGAIHIEPVANTSTVTLEDCWVTNSGAGDAIVASIGGAGLATLNARRCDLGSNAAASIIVLMQTAGAGTLTFNSWDCNFATSGGATNAAIEASAAVVADVNVYRATFSTCTLAVYCTGANHTVDIEEAEFNNNGVELAANAPTVTLTKCNGIGAFTHSTASTVTLRNSYASGAYTTGAVAAILNAYHCQFGAAITHAGTGTFTIETCLTGAISNNGTATMNINASTVGAITQAAVAGIMYLTNCKIGDITTGATGTIRLQGQSYFTDIAVNAGVLTWKVDPNHIKVVAGTANMKVADALTLATAGDVIEIYPGTYAESNLTLKASVNLVGTDPDQCLVVTGDAANAILNAAVTCTVSNLTIGNTDAGHPAIEVTANTLTVRNCYVYGTGAGDSIAMLAGTLIGYDTRVGAGDIDLSTAICTLTMYRCQITTDPVDTAGAFAHVMTFEQCDFGTQNLVSAATGATTLAMRGCTNVGTVSNASTGGAFTIRDSDVGTVTASSTGTFVILGGNINACGGATASITWKTHAQQYETIAGMSIQHAITKAAADTPAPSATSPYTVLLHPGIYTILGQIQTVAYVNIRGLGSRNAVVVYAEDANFWNMTAMEVQGLTCRLNAPSANRYFFLFDAAASSRVLDVTIEATTPGVWEVRPFVSNSASTIRVERCYYNIGGTGTSKGFYLYTAAPTLTILDCDFRFSNANASHIYAADIPVVLVAEGTRWDGTASLMTLLSMNGGASLTFDNCALLSTGVWGTMTGDTQWMNLLFRNCAIEATVLASNISIVRLKNCSYRAVSRTGTGDIVDESPAALDSIYHVVKTPLETLDNLATRTAIGGAVTLGGSGQIRLRINDNAADAAGIENNADAAGALDSSFTAGLTPRYVRQISVSAFRATTTMFFGLRATVGAAVPAAAEDHCGFIWTGAAFNASSSDGAGVGVTTALTTPSTGAQHQLEVIQFRSKVEFYVDGVLVATHTGVGIPTAAGALDFQDYEISTGGGGATTSDITIRNGFVAECPA